MHLDPVLVVWHICVPEDQRAGTNMAGTDPLGFYPDPGMQDSWDSKSPVFLANDWDDASKSPLGGERLSPLNADQKTPEIRNPIWCIAGLLHPRSPDMYIPWGLSSHEP